MSKRETVVLTRTEEDNQRIVPLFEDAGLHVISLPMIAIQDIPVDSTTVLQSLGDKPFVLLTSLKGTKRWLRLRREDERIKRMKVQGYWVVGSRSEELLGEVETGVPIEVVAGSSGELLEKLRKERGEERKGEQAKEREVVYPCSLVRRNEVVEGLAGLGYQVVELPLYEPLLPEQSGKRVLNLADKLDAETTVLFFSPSAVKNFFQLWGDRRRTFHCAAIGHTTAKALYKEGVDQIIVPEHPDVASFIQRLINRS